MSRKQIVGFYALLLGAILSTGCSNGFASLSGKATVDGASAPQGLAFAFNPVGEGRVSYGLVGENGEFVVSCTRTQKGIQPGEYAVALLEPDFGNRAVYEVVSTLPESYRSEIQKVTIKGGRNVLNLELKTATNGEPTFALPPFPEL